MKKKILSLVKKNKGLSGSQLADLLGISRQAVNRHVRSLILDGALAKEGVTRGAVYRIESSTRPAPPKSLSRDYTLNNLAEDDVFRDIDKLLSLVRETSPQSFAITRYAFTEILNNAIDHSLSEKCFVEVKLDEFTLQFRIRDYGIGLFFSLYDKFSLSDEYAAVGELIKGKRTTMKEKHSGEGIFFTSKAADTMIFRSHRIRLIFDNLKKDVFVEESRNIRGTDVSFVINKRSKKKLDTIFSTYAPEEFDYQLEKTRVMVTMFQKSYVSRSEAKRLLHGLEKFRKIILDFKGVKTIGQGFADEIFRVFVRNYPHVSIETENISPALLPMIKHVVDN